jgi:hypothetical protein
MRRIPMLMHDDTSFYEWADNIVFTRLPRLVVRASIATGIGYVLPTLEQHRICCFSESSIDRKPSDVESVNVDLHSHFIVVIFRVVLFRRARICGEGEM